MLVSFHSRYLHTTQPRQGVHRATYVRTRSCSAVGPHIQKMFPVHIKPPTVSAGTRSTLSLTKDQSHATIEREHHIVGEGGILAPSSISACFFYLRFFRERSHITVLTAPTTDWTTPSSAVRLRTETTEPLPVHTSSACLYSATSAKFVWFIDKHTHNT